LELRIARQLLTSFYPAWKGIVFFKSGRAALRGFLCGLRKFNSRYNVIFLPDYICNVVYQASEEAGFFIRTYRTDHAFRPVWGELLSTLHEESHPIVLLASILGAVNSNQEDIQRIKKWNSEAFIILDECQNLTSTSKISFDRKMAVLFSFNKKSVPGLMGGGVCIGDELREYIKPIHLSRKELYEIYFRLLFHMAKDTLVYLMIFLGFNEFQNRELNVYEYSVGRNILYDTRPHEASILSLATAYIELKSLSEHEKIRLRNYQYITKLYDYSFFHHMSFTSNTPLYIPVSRDWAFSNDAKFFMIKRPYAKHKDHLTTMKMVYCINNSLPIPLNTHLV